MSPAVPILLHKARFMMDAMEHYDVRSFIDLGGSWGVKGGYSLQALLSFAIERAYLVDGFMPSGMEERFQEYPAFKSIKGGFGAPKVRDQIEPVDAIFMFDILLHQVGPNWDRVLELYTEKADHFIIYNQQWVGGDNTVRLFDLGEEGYYRHSIFGAEGTKEARAAVAEIFKKIAHHNNGGDWDGSLDAPAIWQWGITTSDLVRRMWDLGYKLDFMKNYGPFPDVQGFENHGFWFRRR